MVKAEAWRENVVESPESRRCGSVNFKGLCTAEATISRVTRLLQNGGESPPEGLVQRLYTEEQTPG